MAAQIDIGRSTLDLVAQKEIQEDVTVIHTPDRAMRMHLHLQARRACDMDGIDCRHHLASRLQYVLRFAALALKEPQPHSGVCHTSPDPQRHPISARAVWHSLRRSCKVFASPVPKQDCALYVWHRCGAARAPRSH